MSYLTDFMKEKWWFWMAHCDLKNNQMRSEDWNEGAERLIREYNLPPQKADEIRESFKHFGAVLLGEGHMTGCVCVESDRVAVNLTRFLLTHRADALGCVESVIRHMFVTVDTDEDDYVNEKELSSVCQCLLIKEKFWNNIYRRLSNPETGRVSITTAVVWWVDFIMGVDNGNWEQLKAVFAM